MVDGQSTDGTAEIVAGMACQHANLRLFHNPRRLSSAARNIGIRHAQGEIVLVVDGHCELTDRQHLRHLAAAFARSGADCIGRPQPLNVEGASTLQRAVAAARSSRLGHHPDSFIYSSQERFVPAKSVAVCYRRKVFDEIGGFDERFDACEDVELNHRVDRAGLRCFFTPEAAVSYVPRSSLRGLFRQMVRYGRGRIRLLRKHPDTFSPGSMVPLVFVLGLIAGGLASLALAWLGDGLAIRLTAAAFAGVLALYAAIVLGTSLAIAARIGRGEGGKGRKGEGGKGGYPLDGHPRAGGEILTSNLPLSPSPFLPFFLWLPLIFVTIHVGSGTGMLLELVTPAQPGTRAPDTHLRAARSTK